MSSSSPQNGVNTECSSEEWLQWEKQRPSGKRNCAKKVSLLCNGPWTEWQMVPGEDCYYERSRHILYKGGRKAMLVLCDEEVAERSCDEVPVSTDTPGRGKQATVSIPDKRPLDITTPGPSQTSIPTDTFRTTLSEDGNKVPITRPSKRVSSSAGHSSSLPPHMRASLPEGLAGSAVAGICLGVVFLIILIALIVFLVIRRKQNKKSDYYSDCDIGDVNSSTRGNTYQEISSLDSRCSYERNIVINSGKFPNEMAHVQSTDKLSNNGYDQGNESSVNLGDTGYYSTMLTGDPDGEPFSNQTVVTESRSSEVNGNGSAVGKSHTNNVLEKDVADSLTREEIALSNSDKDDINLDDRTYHILEPPTEGGDSVHQRDGNDYCSLMERTDSDDPKYDVLRKVNVPRD